MGFLTGVDGLSQISARTCGRCQRWCGSFPGQIRQGKRSRNSRTKAQADQATCAFLLVGGEAARRRPATGRAVRSLGGLGWGMRLRWPWLGIVASFREDDLFEGETCQKSGGFHHLGKNSSEEGKVARKRQFADHCARFVWVLRVLGVLARSPTKGVEVEGRSCLLLDCIVAARRCLGYVEAIVWLPTC